MQSRDEPKRRDENEELGHQPFKKKPTLDAHSEQKLERAISGDQMHAQDPRTREPRKDLTHSGQQSTKEADAGEVRPSRTKDQGEIEEKGLQPKKQQPYSAEEEKTSPSERQKTGKETLTGVKKPERAAIQDQGGSKDSPTHDRGGRLTSQGSLKYHPGKQTPLSDESFDESEGRKKESGLEKIDIGPDEVQMQQSPLEITFSPHVGKQGDSSKDSKQQPKTEPLQKEPSRVQESEELASFSEALRTKAQDASSGRAEAIDPRRLQGFGSYNQPVIHEEGPEWTSQVDRKKIDSRKSLGKPGAQKVPDQSKRSKIEPEDDQESNSDSQAQKKPDSPENADIARRISESHQAIHQDPYQPRGFSISHKQHPRMDVNDEPVSEIYVTPTDERDTIERRINPNQYESFPGPERGQESPQRHKDPYADRGSLSHKPQGDNHEVDQSVMFL